ncbi:MAG: helix-turn-helix transcriptional regulator [Akkermansiaceae bacterium]
MFNQAFNDLLKPQWLAILTELKGAGGMAISDLARELSSNYMTVKQHCEELTKRGYLMRSRVPRTGIGRPEIFYRLSDKAAGMFPSIPSSFTLNLLDHVQQTFGDIAPEKLLFQHFQQLEAKWKARTSAGKTLEDRAKLLIAHREIDGLQMKVVADEESQSLILREFHNPLVEIFEKFPRALAMEQRAMESALGCRLKREVILGQGDLPKYVDFSCL